MAGPKRTTKAHRTQAICKGCGAGFRRGRKGNTFCSQPCYRKWRWKNVHKQKTLDAVVCKQCSEKHWLVQAAWRNGFGASGASVSRLRDLLKRQNYSCSYTGKRLILGVN